MNPAFRFPADTPVRETPGYYASGETILPRKIDPEQETPFLTQRGFTPQQKPPVRQPNFGTMSGTASGSGTGRAASAPPTDNRPYNPEEEHQDIKPKTEEGPLNPGHTGESRNPPDPPPSDSGDDSEEDRDRRRRKRNENKKSKNAVRPAKRDKERKERAIPKLDKLEGANDFQSWNNSMKKYLQMCEVEGKYRYSFWDVVTGDLKEPTPADCMDLQMDLEDWIAADNHAYLTMKKNCEKEPHTLIRLCKTSYDAYKTLVVHYENKMISDLGIVLSNVTSCKYREEDSIHDHINSFETLWETLFATAHGPLKPKHKNFGKGLRLISSDDAAKTELLLATFPPKYHLTIQNLRTHDDFSYGDIVANLKFSIRKPAWVRTNTGTKKDPIVLRTGGPNIDTSKTCGYCIKVKGWRGIGHSESECRTKKREQSNPGVKRLDNKPYEESEDEFELDQGARITEVNANRRNQHPRIHMIRAGKIEQNRTGQYEFDTGAQVHTTNELWRLTDLRPGKTITACNGTKTTAIHEGTLKIKHNGRDITLKNVLYHPSFYNLISGQRVKGDFDIKGRGNSVDIEVNGETLYHAERDISGTMWIKPDEPASIKKVTLMDLHERYGHISFDTLKSLPEGQKYHGKTAPKCEACIAGKSTKPPAKPYKDGKKQLPRSERPLERLHADLIGPFTKEWLGKRYVLTAMDDYTRYCTAIPIKAKSDTKGALKEWIKMLETQCNPLKVVQLQADWGGEFRNTELATWCKKKGIQLKETVPRHSETNATIERLNRTLQDMARTAMISAGVKGLWGDAIQWAAYTKNRIPHKSIKQAPVEALLGKGDRSNLRPFGQKVMIHPYKEERNNDRMAPRSIEARITGYTATHGVYQVITTTGKRKIAKNPVPINQTKEDSDEEDTSEWPNKPVQDLTDIAKGQTGRNYGWHCPEKEGCPEGTHAEDQQEPRTPEKQWESLITDSPSQQLLREKNEPPPAPVKPAAPEPRYPQRMGRDTTNWQDRIAQGLAGAPRIRDSSIHRVGHDDDHPTDEQARAGPKAHEWAKARQIEREKLQKYGVYTIVQKNNIPSDLIPVDTKWVYDVKKGNAGNIIRYRARKVGRGFTQEYGLNYHETFSQMARSESWRVLLTLAINHGWTVKQWDVKAAYLQADLKHEIYVKDLTEAGETEYWKLHKALYGLKQAGHEWYNRLRSIMTTAGLTQCIGDPGCFKRTGIIVSTHVDDMAGYGTPEALRTFEKAINQEVELEHLGQPTKLLGMELTWGKNGSVKLTQRDSIDKLVKEHEIPKVPNKSIPLDPQGYSEPTDHELLPTAAITKYQSLVGSLLYINRMTRPDISLHVNLLGRRTSKPGINNLRTAKQLGQYLASTSEEGLTLEIKELEKPGKDVLINLYADASYGGENSRSQSGSLAILFGAPVMWSSRRQDVVSMSITEAEYIACSEAAKDSQWITQFLKELGMNPRPVLYTDNEAALKLTKTQTFHRRTRHIEHRYHYIRELVDQKTIQITGIKGKNNPADPLTKLLPMSSIGRGKTEISIG